MDGVAILWGVGAAAVFIWAAGCVILLLSAEEESRQPRPRYPWGWPWTLPLWPVFVTGEIIEWRRKEREKRRLLDAMKRR